MEQRRLRLGDNIDDYCPRERRLTTHAVVAMVGDAVKQTRCTTCDTEHVYKGAKVPQRRKPKEEPGVLVPAEARPARALPASAPPAPPMSVAAPLDAVPVERPEDLPGVAAEPRAPDDEGPVHRRLIRAVLPRVDGHVPVRQMPEFTMRQPGVRHPDLLNGNGRRGQDNGSRPVAATPFRGGHGRPFSRPGKGGRPGGSPHGSPHGHGPRRGRHASGGKKRSR
jgi:hypothetical protein